MSNWIGTNGGNMIDLLAPQLDQIHIDDIALGLANVCRFGGQISRWYSVAEHSVHVAEMVPPDLRMIALLHDAAEAYIGDVTTPLKLELGDAYREIEHRLSLVIGEKFGLGSALAFLPQQVKDADRSLCVSERDLLQTAPANWGHEYELVIRYPKLTCCYPEPYSARLAFMHMFRELGGQVQ